jgi:hypothetical protein
MDGIQLDSGVQTVVSPLSTEFYGDVNAIKTATNRIEWWVFMTALLTSLIIYSIEQSPSCEANRFSTSQEISLILWNPKVH